MIVATFALAGCALTSANSIRMEAAPASARVPMSMEVFGGDGAAFDIALSNQSKRYLTLDTSQLSLSAVDPFLDGTRCAKEDLTISYYQEPRPKPVELAPGNNVRLRVSSMESGPYRHRSRCVAKPGRYRVRFEYRYRGPDLKANMYHGTPRSNEVEFEVY
jgi:hypothetical protein